jgi:hypothetical protein
VEIPYGRERERERERETGETLDKGTKRVIDRRRMMKLLSYRMANVVGMNVDGGGDINSLRC